MTEAEPVVAERHGAVLVLALNRPARLNAWTRALERRYFDYLGRADADPEVRAVVVTGTGRGFCAGADMEELQAAAAGQLPPREDTRAMSFPLSFRKPLIAAINGAAAGLGLVQALYCDIRFATPDAKLTTAFARRGLIAEYGSSWLLARLVGPSNALDLLLSGRVIDGDEARGMGLVNRVIAAGDLLPEAIAYAEQLATWSSPRSMLTIKRQLQMDLERTFDEAVGVADHLMDESFGVPDAREGVASYLERRLPAFPPLDGP